jgi:hypothetical protein
MRKVTDVCFLIADTTILETVELFQSSYIPPNEIFLDVDKLFFTEYSLFF